MKAIVVGGTGLIGRGVVQALSVRHEVTSVSLSSGLDITSVSSIKAFYNRIGRVDAIVCTAGSVRFGDFPSLTDSDFRLCLDNKLMGQVNLVRFGIPNIIDGGSFTLTSGVFAEHPVPGSTAISLVNGGLNAFVRAAALELPRQIRINAVSPVIATETLQNWHLDGALGVPAQRFARAYVASVEGSRSGETIDVRRFL